MQITLSVATQQRSAIAALRRVSERLCMGNTVHAMRWTEARLPGAQRVLPQWEGCLLGTRNVRSLLHRSHVSTVGRLADPTITNVTKVQRFNSGEGNGY